jgi:hypothetical protein
MEVSGQLHASGPLPRITYWIEGLWLPEEVWPYGEKEILLSPAGIEFRLLSRLAHGLITTVIELPWSYS